MTLTAQANAEETAKTVHTFFSSPKKKKKKRPDKVLMILPSLACLKISWVFKHVWTLKICIVLLANSTLPQQQRMTSFHIMKV